MKNVMNTKQHAAQDPMEGVVHARLVGFTATAVLRIQKSLLPHLLLQVKYPRNATRLVNATRKSDLKHHGQPLALVCVSVMPRQDLILSMNVKAEIIIAAWPDAEVALAME